MYLNIVINFDQEQILMCFMLDIREFSLQYCKELNCLLLNKNVVFGLIDASWLFIGFQLHFKVEPMSLYIISSENNYRWMWSNLKWLVYIFKQIILTN